VALAQPFEELIGPYLPVMVQTVLLPFKNRIVYDGLMSIFNISFGPGIRRGLNEDFKQTKARHGIVTSVPMSESPIRAKARKPKPIAKPPSKKDAAELVRAINSMIDIFCGEHLNGAYAVLLSQAGREAGA